MPLRLIARGLLAVFCVSVCAHAAAPTDERSKGTPSSTGRLLLAGPQLQEDDSPAALSPGG